MVSKACRKCKILSDSGECPICHGSNLSDSWKGRIFIINPEKSEVAKKLGLKLQGEYAIKVR